MDTSCSFQECTPISSGEILCNSPAGFSNGQTLFYGLQFDGFTMYEDYKKFNNKSKIEIVIDPKPTREIELVQEYKPLFDTELKIEVRVTDCNIIRIFFHVQQDLHEVLYDCAGLCVGTETMYFLTICNAIHWCWNSYYIDMIRLS